MSNKAEKNLSEFWNNKIGKNILSLGGWLKFCGIFSCILNIIIVFVVISNDDLYLEPIGYVSYLYAICSSIYFAIQGDHIRKKELSPVKLNDTCSTIILLMVIYIVFMAIITGGSGRVLSVAGAIILCSSIRYKVEWHKIYEQAYSGNTISNKEKPKKEVEAAKEEPIEEKQNNIEDDEFYDEEF